jgi:predicted transcriptional regulator
MNEKQKPALPQTNVSGSLPIEEVALHAADDWYDTAKFRSDVKADLKSYYEGYRDAMRFCQGNDR